MSGTKRVPLSRQHTPPVSERAIRLFIKMQRYPRTWRDDRWWDLEQELRHEVHAKLWDYPCIEDPAEGNPETPGTGNYDRWRPNETARALWRALNAGARELRRRERAARREREPEPVA
jgi:hypothetical protein